MMVFRLCSARSSSANCYTHLVRGAVLSPTLIGSASAHSCSEVNVVDSVRRTCRGLTNYWKTPTLLCLKKSLLTVVTSCVNFYRHFPRLHRTSLRDRTHQFRLPDRTGRLMDCDFLVRSLFKDVY